MPKELALLVCPVCRSGLELRLEVVATNGVGAETVRCTGCERGFPVVDGIPILLADRATRYI